ncbi:hypothetical protein ACFQ1R_15220 [Mariniflexile jejuense]|uniref:Uncharacterized protein n=1 Tax=Mariniflexile jejuense TaxID=1173582 RepID=A0ABW3JM08_9FLAO
MIEAINLLNNQMILKNKRILVFLIIAIMLLLTPFIAMQFTNEVNWTLLDFMIAGVLLFSTVFFIELTLNVIKKKQKRLILLVIILLFFKLIWLELAVGIFGTALAGS